jgi:hypothetical protein
MRETKSTNPNMRDLDYMTEFMFMCVAFAYHCSNPVSSQATPLLTSAYWGRVESCQVLLSAKADAAAKDRCNTSPLSFAAALFFATHARSCRDGNTPLKLAYIRTKSDVFDLLQCVGAPYL